MYPLTKLVQQNAAIGVWQLLQRAQHTRRLSVHGSGAGGGSGLGSLPGVAPLLPATKCAWRCGHCLVARWLRGNGRGCCKPGAGQGHQGGHRAQR